MTLNNEHHAILYHTMNRAFGRLYCGDSTEMQELVQAGLMVSAGKKSFAPDEYFTITYEGKQALEEAHDTSPRKIAIDWRRI